MRNAIRSMNSQQIRGVFRLFREWKEFLSSSFFTPHFKGNHQRTTAAGKILCTAPSTATSAAAISYRSNLSITNQVKEGSRHLQAPLATGHLPRSLLDEQVVIFVQNLFNKYQVREPITKEEMLGNVIQLHKIYFHGILKKASENLQLIFGLDIKEMDPKRHMYVLVNKLELRL